ncbi:uncharacterized protein [Populus alba]|uniref:uncharacterized protein isoform X2 n=1 Tax=Populus alba TaxID=43335 RepID=UPI003CC73CFC
MVLALRLSLCIRSCLFCISLLLKYFFVAVVLCPPSASPFFTQSLCSVRPQTTFLLLLKTLSSHYIREQNAPWTTLRRFFFMQASAVKLSQFGDFVFSNMLYWIAKSMYKFKIDRQRNGQNRALPKASPGSEKLKRHTCERLRNVGGDHGCCDSKCHSRNRVYKGRTNSRKLNCMNLNHVLSRLFMNLFL